MGDSSELHDDVVPVAGAPAVSNPLAQSLNVVVSVPESIQIRMVDASVLADYEIWFFIASLLASAATGFLVAFIQEAKVKDGTPAPIGYMTLVLAILLAISIGMAVWKRNCLRKKSRDVCLKATEALT